jgi:hypothetical protein
MSSCPSLKNRPPYPPPKTPPYKKPIQYSENISFSPSIKKSSTHNLDICEYTLKELFELFEIHSYPITFDNIKHAKKKVLQSHPDKSHLPSEYFLFYKQAFELIVSVYDNQNKVSQNTVEKKDYSPLQIHSNIPETQIQQSITDMKPSKFNETFNRLFEENMSEKPDYNKNAWFTSSEPVFQETNAKNISQMNIEIDKIKEKSQAMSIYRGVMPLQLNQNSGSSIYEDDSESNDYISSDIFSKLKFDDLRKVHKDQTVFAVREQDFQKVQTFQSVDQYVRSRDKLAYVPMEKTQAEKLLEQQEKQLQETILKKQHAAELKQMEYAEKNKTILSSFLRLH